MLERAFRWVASGFYVDVGASDPEYGSMTKHFYDRGWRGINIEPGSWFPRLAAARPRDVNLNVAVSDAEGAITFYERPEVPGMSSVSPHCAPAVNGESTRPVARTVAARTLRGLLDDVGAPQIDFMSIDVEGHEEQVLRGNDWERHRPRVLVIESTLPNTTILCHQAWEPLLLAARYRFVFFNGINRFYVRDEDAGLAEQLETPATALDQYVPLAQFHLSRANERLGHDLARLQAQLGQQQAQQRRHAEMLRGLSGRSLRCGLWVGRLLQRAARGVRRIMPAGFQRGALRRSESDHGSRL
ncbi:MAG: FkbM family methyltransferase [Gemmataceae bacterium]|nr:FkbM family methyltransferase [Gemmataceae bacterium]